MTVLRNLGNEFRRWTASILVNWLVLVTPKADVLTLIHLHKLLSAMILEDEMHGRDR